MASRPPISQGGSALEENRPQIFSSSADPPVKSEIERSWDALYRTGKCGETVSYVVGRLCNHVRSKNMQNSYFPASLPPSFSSFLEPAHGIHGMTHWRRRRRRSWHVGHVDTAMEHGLIGGVHWRRCRLLRPLHPRHRYRVFDAGHCVPPRRHCHCHCHHQHRYRHHQGAKARCGLGC